MDSDIYIYCVDSVLVDVCMTIYNHILYIYVAWLDISEVLAILIWGKYETINTSGFTGCFGPTFAWRPSFFTVGGAPKG